MRPATVAQPKRELLIREAQERSIIQRRPQVVDVGRERFVYSGGHLVEYRRDWKNGALER